MAKKLKKKIEDLCGLSGLDWEARQERANQILASPEWKQRLCNELTGLSFRELEQTLSGVATERQKKENDAHLANKSSRHSGRKAPRSLAEILAQVYAPRVVYELSQNHISSYESSRERASDEIPSDSYDANDKSEQ